VDISDFPTRHSYFLGLWQQQIERILAGWVDELGVRIYRGCEVTGFAQDDLGVEVALSDGTSLRAEYLVGCDGGRSVIRKAAGIDFAGWDPTKSSLFRFFRGGPDNPFTRRIVSSGNRLRRIGLAAT
jgi:3-(3-hydroxy-phenyl)propionate hydroxylase